MIQQHSLVVESGIDIPASVPARETLALCVFADAPHLPDAPRLGALRQICEEAIAEAGFEGEEGATLLVHAASADGADQAGAKNSGDGATSDKAAGNEAGRARRVLLVGLGEHADFDAHVLRRAAGAAARRARHKSGGSLRFVLPETLGADLRALARAAAEGAHLGLYENGFYQRAEEDEPRLDRLVIVVSSDADNLEAEFERARIVAESANWARSLSDEPGLSLPPREFARRAAEMAAQFGLVVESLSAEEIQRRGMGALLGVAQGSEEEPALIVVRYEPERPGGVAAEDGAGELWAFVGKGITFDTGGISIKHGLDMYEMKADMAGGAAVLGALRAIAQLKPARRVVGIVPAAENMPSGKAIKPGDVVRTLAGHTVEVVDTDAEGRLVLIDGIAYARQLGATQIVDLATLTGSIVVALGTHRTGLFSNDDDWAARVTAAAARAGEPVWRMPVSDDYNKKIESMIADFKNYGGRPDATGAALLLSKFAGETPWVHLDIAGTSWFDDPQPHAPKGSTGTGVRTLVELACEQAD
jgi:leucyl aminopeptidase